MKYPLGGLSGDHIVKVIPVPIPNTAVKLSEPMIVHTSVKVGIAGFLNSPVVYNGGVFLCAHDASLSNLDLEMQYGHWPQTREEELGSACGWRC